MLMLVIVIVIQLQTGGRWEQGAGNREQGATARPLTTDNEGYGSVEQDAARRSFVVISYLLSEDFKF